jgi:hypothetical protein
MDHVSYRPTLAVHVVWHPRSKVGPTYGQALFSHLFEDPGDLTAHGLRIPVRLWRSEPVVPPIKDAQHTALVVLLDDALIGDRQWQKMLAAIPGTLRKGDVLLPVSVSPRAAQLNAQPALASQMIRLQSYPSDLRDIVLVNQVSHALFELLTKKRLSVFLSHAKFDGLRITERVRRHLNRGTHIEQFFDAQDLRPGSKWAEAIRNSTKDHLLLAIRTDAYATREWCRTEVLEAKGNGSPVVVLDALTSFEPRGFPYLGNAPAVRWSETESRASLEHLVRVILREALRFRYFPRRVEDIKRAYGLTGEAQVLPSPPELLTALRASGRVIYPDPPLGTEELKVVRELATNIEPMTPNTMIASR